MMSSSVTAGRSLRQPHATTSVAARRATALPALASGGSNNGVRGFIGGRGGGGNGGSSGIGASGGSGGESPQPRWVSLLGSLALTLAGQALLGVCSADAAAKPTKGKGKAPPKEELTIETTADVLWNITGPLLTNLGFSGCVGAACGFAIKKAAQLVAFIIGLGFIMLQGLAYTGLVTVHWNKANDVIAAALDVNKDGKLDHSDFKVLTSQALSLLATGVPSVGGFLAGFVLAIKAF